MSLLLDALKKAAEEKQRMGGEEPASARPKPQPAQGGGQSGSQLMSLLQGKNQEDEQDNVEGFEPFGDDTEGKSGFSLSLIDEGDESLDKLGFKEQPLPEPEPEPEPNPLASFTLELLDEDEEPPSSPNPVASPAPVSTSLTLLDDDEPVPIAPPEPLQQTPAEAPEPVVERPPAEPEVQPASSAEQPPADSPVVAAGDTAVEPVVNTTTPVQTVAEIPLVEKQAPVTADIPVEPPQTPVPEVPVRPITPEHSPQPDTPRQAYEAAPEMVLDALQRRRRRQRVLVLSLLLSVGLVAGGWGFLMYEEQLQQNDQLMSRYRLQPDPQPRALPARPESRPEDTATTTTVAATAQQPLSMQASPVAGTEAPQASATSAVETVQVQERAENNIDLASSQVEPVPEPQPSTAASTTARATDTERVTVTRTLVDKGILEDEARLGIERRRTEARVLSAYRAFRDGDLKTALQLYQQALAEDPFSRDAVMGLAAIAAAERDYGKAAYYYQQLLDYDPTDASAFEGLIGLPDTGLDLVDMESRLRNYLANNPDSVRGQARLGRVMARQKRWHEAQQAFFNAHRLDPEQPAYALNVAIALDHLRKYSAARRYYEQAVRLAARKGKDSGINLASARQRLDALSQLGH